MQEGVSFIGHLVEESDIELLSLSFQPFFCILYNDSLYKYIYVSVHLSLIIMLENERTYKQVFFPLFLQKKIIQ